MLSDDLKLIKNVISNYRLVKDILANIKKIKGKLVDLCLEGHITETEFYRVSSLLTPQSRSALWEKYFIIKHNALRVSANDNAGDFILDGTNYEYKASCNDDMLVHIVQVRLWQQCDYIIQVIMTEGVLTFRLTHKQMEREMEVLNASSAHGTKESNLNNKNVELRATFAIDGPHWDRWVREYVRH